ncbi:MAG: WG repeat-containing protein [Prevotellaceae bacterium]|nr:WG repeat-containing protein [Candidatus Minthosoma caballi]
MKNIVLLFVLLLFPALMAHADGDENEAEVKAAVRMVRVKHPVTKKWGYAFKEQNINSPLHGIVATSINVLGTGSALLSKKESELIDWAVPSQYDEVASKFTDDLAMVAIGDKIGFINIYNCFILPPIYDRTNNLDGFCDGLAAVRKNGKWGFINRTGKYLIPAEYDDAESFSKHHTALVKKGENWGMIDLEGNVVLPFEYGNKTLMTLPLKNKAYKEAVEKVEQRYNANEYAARIKEINSLDLPASKPQASAVAPAKTTKGKGKPAAATKPVTVASPKVFDLYRQQDELTYNEAWEDGLLGIKDNYGRWIVPPLFNAVTQDKDDQCFIVCRDSLYGCYLWNGARVVNTFFDSMSEFNNGRSHVSSYGVHGYLDLDGNMNPDFISDLAEMGKSTEITNSIKAHKIYERCTDISPDYASAYNNIGILDLKAHDYNKGMRNLKLAIELEPDNEIFTNNLEIAKNDRKERRSRRLNTGLTIATAVISLGCTAYSTYSSISGNSSSGGGYSSSSVSSSGSSGGGGGNHSCGACRGSGVCKVCGGSGQGARTAFGTNVHVNCPSCHGSKICKYCHGKKSSYSGGATGATCNDCHGAGKCWECNGTGVANGSTCWRCNGSKSCKSCGGKGTR